eukprot:evm.model.scf_1106.1 EVM.evm.TU.scf_1106.1   scf_1106:2279-3575(+)
MGESSASSAFSWRCGRAEDSSSESGVKAEDEGPAGGLNGSWAAPLGQQRKIPFSDFAGRGCSQGGSTTLQAQVVTSLNTLRWGLASSRATDSSAQLSRCLALTQQTPNSLEVAHALSTLGCQLNASGKHKEAEQVHRRAFSIASTRLGGDHLELSYCLDWLGLSLFLQGEFTEALLVCYSIKDIVEKRLGRNHPNVCGCLLNMASVYDAMGWFLYAWQVRDDARVHYSSQQANQQKQGCASS